MICKLVKKASHAAHKDISISAHLAVRWATLKIAVLFVCPQYIQNLFQTEIIPGETVQWSSEAVKQWCSEAVILPLASFHHNITMICWVVLHVVWLVEASHPHTWGWTELAVTGGANYVAVDTLELWRPLLFHLQCLSFFSLWSSNWVEDFSDSVTNRILLLLRQSGRMPSIPSYYDNIVQCRSSSGKNTVSACVDGECMTAKTGEGSAMPRKSSSSSSSMSQASLVLRANSWKLAAFLDFTWFNLGFASLGYLKRRQTHGFNTWSKCWRCTK